LEARCGAIKGADLAVILGVDDKHIYRMAARGQIPSFRVGRAVRFDPQEVAKWLREKYGHETRLPRKAPRSSRSSEERVSSAA
jgi:excisionase family DNA binding protein